MKKNLKILLYEALMRNINETFEGYPEKDFWDEPIMTSASLHLSLHKLLTASFDEVYSALDRALAEKHSSMPKK